MLNLKDGRLLGALVGGVALLGLAGAPVMAQDAAQPPSKVKEAGQPGNKDKDGAKPRSEQAAKAKVGEAAPAFELKDTDGKTVKLSDYKGKIVVLEWFNPDCPIVVGLYKKDVMHKTQESFKGKDVVWLSINSGAPGQQGHGLERNADARKEWKMNWPVLLDESGATGKAYGATNTPHMYVIDAKGTLVYAGAIDDKGKTNYVENAVTQTLKGESDSPSTTKAYGCSVKYGKQGA